MTAPKIEHEERIADARNSLAEVINRARYLQEPTFLTNRGKRVAVVSSVESHQDSAILRELRAYLGELEGTMNAPSDVMQKARVIREALNIAADRVES